MQVEFPIINIAFTGVINFDFFLPRDPYNKCLAKHSFFPPLSCSVLKVGKLASGTNPLPLSFFVFGCLIGECVCVGQGETNSEDNIRLCSNKTYTIYYLDIYRKNLLSGNLCESDVLIISSCLFECLNHYAYYMCVKIGSEMKSSC